MATRRHIFLDRDGTINLMPSYDDAEFDSPRVPAHFEFLEGALEALVALSSYNWLHVVTNQPGVAYGKLLNERAAHQVNNRMVALVEAAGGHIDTVRTCFFTEHAERIVTPVLRKRYYRVNHPDRKPNPGMLLRIGEECGVDFNRAVMIGDRAIDLEAGRRAGCGTLIMVQNPLYSDERFEGAVSVPSLAEAARLVLEQTV